MRRFLEIYKIIYARLPHQSLDLEHQHSKLHKIEGK